MQSQPANPIFSEEYDHLREVLVRTRHEAGLSQSALGARLGRTSSHIALIEKGQRRLEILDFYNLISALGYDPTEVAATVFAGFREIQTQANRNDPTGSA